MRSILIIGFAVAASLSTAIDTTTDYLEVVPDLNPDTVFTEDFSEHIYQASKRSYLQPVQSSSAIRPLARDPSDEAALTYDYSCTGGNQDAPLHFDSCSDSIDGKMSGEDCRSVCKCTNDGVVDCQECPDKCASARSVTKFCETTHKPYWDCRCKNTKTLAVRDRNLEETISVSAPIRPASMMHTAVTAQYSLQCPAEGPIDYELQYVCADNNKDFLLPISTENCSEWCSCDSHGNMDCPSPADGCKDNDGVTIACKHDFECSCVKPQARTDGDRTTGEPLLEAAQHVSSKLDLSNSIIVSLDGVYSRRDAANSEWSSPNCVVRVGEEDTFLPLGVCKIDQTHERVLQYNWLGCLHNCECGRKNGAMRCGWPSDCELTTDQRTLIIGCHGSPDSFWSCICSPAETADVAEVDEVERAEITSEPNIEPEDPASEPKFIAIIDPNQAAAETEATWEPGSLLLTRDSEETIVAKLCSGKSLTTEGYVGPCMDGNELYWDGNQCGKYCKCDGSGKLTCSHPDDCATDEQVNTYCRSNSNFQCDCLTEVWGNQEEEATVISNPPYTPIVTTKVPVTTTRSRTTVWFPPVVALNKRQTMTTIEVSAETTSGSGTVTCPVAESVIVSVPDSTITQTADSSLSPTALARLDATTVPMTTVYAVKDLFNERTTSTIVPAFVIPASAASELVQGLPSISMTAVTPQTIFTVAGPTETTIYALGSKSTGGFALAAVLAPTSVASSVVTDVKKFKGTEVLVFTLLPSPAPSPSTSALEKKSASDSIATYPIDPPTTDSAQISATTMYGRIGRGSSTFWPAFVVPTSLAPSMSEIMPALTITPVIPSTVLIGSQYPSITGIPTPSDPTTIYAAYSDETTDHVLAAIVATSLASSVASVFSKNYLGLVTPATLPLAGYSIETAVPVAIQERDDASTQGIGKKGSWAMVCEVNGKQDKLQTQHCQGFDYQFYCTAEGKIVGKGEYADFSNCDEDCKCIDMDPKPLCFLSYTDMTTCFKKRDDGTTEWYDVNTAQVEGLHQRGEVDVRSSWLTARGETDVDRSTLDNPSSPIGPTTLSTVTSPKYTPSSAASLEEQDDHFMLVCGGRNMAYNIYSGNCPNRAISIYLNGLYCGAHCGCDSNGCVSCDAHGEPEFINDCGGNDHVTKFCGTISMHWYFFDCYCKERSTDTRSGCNPPAPAI